MTNIQGKPSVLGIIASNTRLNLKILKIYYLTFKFKLETCAQLINFYDKVMISERLDCSLDESIPNLKKF